MEKNLAEQIIKKMLEFNRPIDDMVDLLKQIPDDDERLLFRTDLGEAMGHLAVLNVRLVKQYPDLDPYKDIVFEEDDPLRWRPNLGKES